jgi:peptidoglycan/xylan/chitin deacetylase (PgdA/CDA1 family)
MAAGRPARYEAASGSSLFVRRRDFLIGCGCAACLGAAGPSFAGIPKGLVEPHMHFVPHGRGPQVAMTLDACMGETDMRILGPLVTNRIPVTIFATKRWLDNNPPALALLLQHKDLFDIQNHGAMHLPAVIGTEKVYGLEPAGTPDAVVAEVQNGERAVTAATGVAPTWYRDATALYSRDAMGLIGELNLQIAGFSLNGDIGASVPAGEAHARISAAKSGDVIISHINQPKRPAGAGVIAGILALKTRGFGFVHLDDVTIARTA